MDLHDPNRYSSRKRWNRVSNFLSSCIMGIVTIGVIVLLVKYCIPWISMLLETIK